MTTTTSHGSPGSGAAVPPLRREVIVDADRDLAFRVFTERIGAWWPLAEHSVHGADATVAFVEPGVGARIVETIDGAEDATWGTVSRWEPGEALAFTWHPGHGHDAASRVLVTFTTVDGEHPGAARALGLGGLRRTCSRGARQLRAGLADRARRGRRPHRMLAA